MNKLLLVVSLFAVFGRAQGQYTTNTDSKTSKESTQRSNRSNRAKENDVRPTSNGVQRMRRFEENTSGREITARVNETFEISLPENRTTGFRWVIESNGEPVCSMIHELFQAPAGTPGKPGTHLWQFRAVQSGTAKIVFHYQRAWERPVSPRSFAIQVQVMD